MISKYSADNIPEVALSWASEGEPVVLATVIETWGSAPRRVGAQMAIGLNGKMQGSVSGGCIESAVVSEAQEAIETKSIKLLEYGVSNEDAFSVGLACGGKIRVMLEPVGHTISLETLQKLVDFRKNKVPVACVVNIITGETKLQTEGYSERFSGFEEENKKSPPFLPRPDILKPLPSSIFFLTLSVPLTGTLAPCSGLMKPQE